MKRRHTKDGRQASNAIERQVPESIPQNPDSIPHDPNSIPHDPDSIPQNPDSIPHDPDSPPQDPDSIPQVPDSTPKVPDSTPQVPDANPNVPDSIPQVPESKPQAAGASPDSNPHIPDSIPYVLQNLKAVYGVPTPYRGLDPLDVLIETILSQSTTNANSDRAFANLKTRFPTWEQAMRARVTSIETAIKSGGLAKQKSSRIKELLIEIYRRRGSLDLSFLKTAPLHEAKEFLGSLKGVGPKTVACTLLFAYNRPVFPIDTHIFRIARRLGLIPKSGSDHEAHRLMARMIPPKRYYEAHINLIRLGRRVCRPQAPLCEQCCLLDYCEYYVNN